MNLVKINHSVLVLEVHFNLCSVLILININMIMKLITCTRFHMTTTVIITSTNSNLKYSEFRLSHYIKQLRSLCLKSANVILILPTFTLNPTQYFIKTHIDSIQNLSELTAVDKTADDTNTFTFNGSDGKLVESYLKSNPLNCVSVFYNIVDKTKIGTQTRWELVWTELHTWVEQEFIAYTNAHCLPMPLVYSTCWRSFTIMIDWSNS